MNAFSDLNKLAFSFKSGGSHRREPASESVLLSYRHATQGRLTLAKPLPDQLPAWIVPTNLINEPLHSFTAVRGFGPWLSQQPFWKALQVGEAPDQLFTWAQTGNPFLEYLAAPLSNASNVVEKVGEGLMQRVNPLFATNRMASIERSTNFHGFVLNRVPVMMPFVRDETLDTGNWLHAGVAPVSATNTPPPQETIHQLLTTPELVYLDSELTGPRTEAWLYLSQLSRLMLLRYQVTATTAAIPWLKAAGPLLGPASTRILKQGQTDLVLERRSSIGLTGMEIHLLFDWLESPLFPFGSHTRLAKLPPPRLPPTGQPQNK